MAKTFSNPESLPTWKDFFTNIVTVEANSLKTVYLAGQVGVDHSKNFVGNGDLESQTQQSFKNVSTALATVGATLADITKITIYVVNYKPENAAVIGKVIGAYFPNQKPACSLIGVQALAEERFLIEVEAIAVVESNPD